MGLARGAGRGLCGVAAGGVLLAAASAAALRAPQAGAQQRQRQAEQQQTQATAKAGLQKLQRDRHVPPPLSLLCAVVVGGCVHVIVGVVVGVVVE